MTAMSISPAPGAPAATQVATRQSSGLSRLSARSTAQQPQIKEALRMIADDAMSRRSQDLAVLTASVTKYMLTTLDPAIALVEEIRVAMADRDDAEIAQRSSNAHAAEALGVEN